VNPESIALLMAIQTQLNAWLEIMKEEPHFAVPEFMLEQLWNRCEQVISSSGLAEVPEFPSESSPAELSKDES
jgi:hypothetical protein